MVDFQERDTRRGLEGSDEPDDEPEPEDEPMEGDHEGEHTEDHEHGHEDDDNHEHTHDHEEEHGHHAHDVDQLGVAILTVSSSRTLDSDPSGDAIEAAVEAEEHLVVTRELVGDSHDTVQQNIDALTNRRDVDILISTGGTGVTPDDVTIEAVRPLMDKQLPGFGELFRLLSYDEIGSRVVATRAMAGIVDGVPVFCLPGSENAVTLGVEEIVLPEAGHLAGLAHPADETTEE